MLVIGPAIIVSSVATRYYVGGLVGSALILWGVWETPEIHPYLKLIINWKSRKQNVEVNQSPNAKVVAVGGDVGRDVNIYHLQPKTEPLQTAPQQKPEPEEATAEIAPHPLIDDTPMLGPKRDISYNISLKKDSEYLIEVNSDEPVDVELISATEWIRKAENPKYRYTVERSRSFVRNANIIFVPRRSGDWVLYILSYGRLKQQLGVRVTHSN